MVESRHSKDLLINLLSNIALCLGGQESNIWSATNAWVFVYLYYAAAAAFSGGHLITVLIWYTAQTVKIQYSQSHTLSSIYYVGRSYTRRPLMQL